MIKIFGHLAPDTDATCSALIWEWYLTKVQGKEARAFVLETPNTEAAFVLKHWGVEMPPVLDPLGAGDEVVIVDTNNPAELPENINDTQIAEIIDHHALVGGLKTKNPIKITIRPVAATATVMSWQIGRDLDTAPDHIKGLMLSCVLSDTLEFRSPTTTPTDRALATKLARDLSVDIPAYAAKMFAAKSDVSHFSDAELLRLDSKKYTTDGVDFRVSVLETTSPEVVLARKTSLMAAMETVAAEDNVDQVLLFVIDILNEEATLLIPNDRVKALAQNSFGAQVDADLVVLPGVMSRKKQIIPNLTV
ncbi:MAG: manganese-dependent inorganic pyrophosphatase [Alphaproteobacteria bacterium]|nr:manganese-dependent inorganic pyrophosphatase [Alphaproteobacteria bacterium]